MSCLMQATAMLPTIASSSTIVDLWESKWPVCGRISVTLFSADVLLEVRSSIWIWRLLLHIVKATAVCLRNILETYEPQMKCHKELRDYHYAKEWWAMRVWKIVLSMMKWNIFRQIFPFSASFETASAPPDPWLWDNRYLYICILKFVVWCIFHKLDIF
jgi:hypothetical protein